MSSADRRFLPRWEVAGVDGAVVVIDVIRAFTTAAFAFGAGAAEIFLVATVDEALAFKAARPGCIAMGEDRGRKPAGFDLPNSPVMASRADLDGRTVVQRTSAGTQGVVAASSATRLWAAGLVCASATAAAVNSSGLGDPTYVITGRFPDRPDGTGEEDLLASRFIESVRLGIAVEPSTTAAAVLATDDARHTLQLGAEHVHPEDIEHCVRIDHFDFAMEVERTAEGLRLVPRAP